MLLYRHTISTDHPFKPHELLVVSEKKNTLVSEILGMNIFHTESLTLHQMKSLVLWKKKTAWKCVQFWNL